MHLNHSLRPEAALAQAMQRFEAARADYEACFRGVDPFFSPVRCNQQKRALTEARDHLQACTHAVTDPALVAKAQSALERPVEFMGCRVSVHTIKPPPLPSEFKE